MSSVLAHPNIRAALMRADMFPPSADVTERLLSACEHPDVTTESILEVSRADWGNEEQRTDDVLVVQTTAGIFMIVKIKRGILRSDVMARIRCLYEWYRDLIDDDDMGGPGIFFHAKPGHHDFLLLFSSGHERDRMLSCLFAAHRGRLSRWGLQHGGR